MHVRSMNRVVMNLCSVFVFHSGAPLMNVSAFVDSAVENFAIGECLSLSPSLSLLLLLIFENFSNLATVSHEIFSKSREIFKNFLNSIVFASKIKLRRLP